MTVHSKHEMGSTFRLDIPLQPADVDNLVSPVELTAVSAKQIANAGNTALIALRPETVLVDDGEANRRLIELVLSRAGALVVTANDGLEAIERIAEQPPALVLMDMQMPVLGGYTATRRLRAAGFAAPIVSLTGKAIEKNVSRRDVMSS